MPGVEGIKGASLPPPGFYVRDYNLAYYADPLEQCVRVTTPMFLISGRSPMPTCRASSGLPIRRFLGGYVGVDALLPFVYQSLRVPGYDHDTFGVGDFFAETTLSWHPKQFDFAAGVGVWAPTGDSPTQLGPSTRTGLGYWTPMLTAGATWYIDEEKTWAVSALNRYEFNTEQRDTHITPGEAYTLEWGVSKTVAKVVDLGVVGYYQQQVTTDSGTGAPRTATAWWRSVPEVNVAFPKPMLFVSFRYNYEFMARIPRAGPHVHVTLTKRF